MAVSRSQIKADWEMGLVEQKSRLRKKRYAGLLKSLDYETFQTTMVKADQCYRERNIARHMESLSPVLRQLEAFMQAFNALTAVNPEGAGLVWGGIQIVLVVIWGPNQPLLVILQA